MSGGDAGHGGVDRRVRVAAWFLAVSYGLSAPVTMYFEFRGSDLSVRFDLPAALIYVTSAVQTACAFGVLTRRFAVAAAVVLTVTTIGAIGAHLRIGSPATAIAAVAYTVIQIWFGLRIRALRSPGTRGSMAP